MLTATLKIIKTVLKTLLCWSIYDLLCSPLELFVCIKLTSSTEMNHSGTLSCIEEQEASWDRQGCFLPHAPQFTAHTSLSVALEVAWHCFVRMCNVKSLEIRQVLFLGYPVFTSELNVSLCLLKRLTLVSSLSTAGSKVTGHTHREDSDLFGFLDIQWIAVQHIQVKKKKATNYITDC